MLKHFAVMAASALVTFGLMMAMKYLGVPSTTALMVVVGIALVMFVLAIPLNPITMALVNYLAARKGTH